MLTYQDRMLFLGEYLMGEPFIGDTLVVDSNFLAKGGWLLSYKGAIHTKLYEAFMAAIFFVNAPFGQIF